jgi:DNA repair exonuclease SbcCD nuclease subunit
MSDPIKFVHASDFHLDKPISGLSEIPNHLIQTLASAPYEAAQRVFDFALTERVDFVLLSGDLFDHDSGSARAPSFLLNNFQKLAEHDIHVYWCAGTTDHPDRWPSSIELPETVVTFSSTVVEEVEHVRGAQRIATIMASGYDAKRRNGDAFAAPVGEGLNIALTHGEFESSSLSADNISYWAMGGKHKATRLDRSGSIVAWPGTTQGRTPKESGTRGFNYVRVDSAGKMKMQTVSCDRVRWLPQKISITENVGMQELKKALSERALKIIADTTDQIVLSRWFLTTDGNFNPRIRREEWTTEVLEWLRDEFGRGDRGLWSTIVDVETPKSLPMEWYEEDTILGEYLRAVGRYQSDDSLKLNLHEYMPHTVKNDMMASVAHVTRERRDITLRRAGMIGVNYLAGHKNIEEVDHGELDESDETLREAS